MLRIKSVDFGTTGLTGSVGYRLINATGSLTLARTNSGIIAFGSGAYLAEFNIPDNWSGVVLWDDGKTPRLYAHELIEKSPGTFSYANIALIPTLGTHLQSRIDGSIKRNTGGTFSYSLIAQIGTHLLGRIPGTIKKSIEGTFSYGNIALLPSLGTHLQGRIPGSMKRTIEGTFSYSLIAQIGTHLNARIFGSVHQKGAGTFSYANITLIPGLGTHLQSRITGSIADASALGTHLNSRITGTMPSLAVLGTHLNSRIPGTVATRGDMGTIKGATFDKTTDSLEAIRDASAGGSTPSYIGSVIWGKMNPNSFSELPNTFGQRIQKILDRASSGVGGVAVASQIFSEKEKQTLFNWIKSMIDRILAIEIIVSQFNPETKKAISQVVVDIKTGQTKLQEILQNYLKTDVKQKEGIKDNLNFIANSFEDIANMNKNVTVIKTSLIQLAEEIPVLIHEIPLKSISSTVTTNFQDLRNLISQSINIASDVSEKLKNNLIILEEQRESTKLTDKVMLSLIPAEKLKKIIENE